MTKHSICCAGVTSPHSALSQRYLLGLTFPHYRNDHCSLKGTRKYWNDTEKMTQFPECISIDNMYCFVFLTFPCDLLSFLLFFPHTRYDLGGMMFSQCGIFHMFIKLFIAILGLHNLQVQNTVGSQIQRQISNA
ncbi:hypothetical protein DFH11DRAFT_1132998 [Phellopilus nigrolimitatus]|nr:hypothetical protein DFH11DRAFT_1132998 [Phellopilus nigrolimitatus]